MTPDDYFSALLEAIERHTQATQAHTAAVHSLLSKLPVTVEERSRQFQVEKIAGDALERAVVTGQLQAIDDDLDELVTGMERLVDRLGLLRQSLTIDKPREAPAHENTGPTIIPSV